MPEAKRQIAKIVFLDRATLGPDVQLPSLSADHEWRDYDATKPSERLERLRDAHVLVTNKVAVSASLLAELPELRLVGVAATGTDVVDMAACREHGIDVLNVTNYAQSSVAEHVFAMILSLRRRLTSYQRRVRQGDWETSDQFWFYDGPMYGLQGTTLGLVGTGALASAVAKVGQSFGMQVISHSLSGRRTAPGHELVSLEDLIERSDIVSLHCPLTSASENLIDSNILHAMKSSALLINTARGAIVDIDALHLALQEGQIAGAGLDVAPVEPAPTHGTFVKIAAMENAVVTPHAAWAGNAARQALANQLVAKIDAWLDGDRSAVL
ncbi:MAG: NAD(P)-dependent oxidoreductase [Pseudomonadota bacterium]